MDAWFPIAVYLLYVASGVRALRSPVERLTKEFVVKIIEEKPFSFAFSCADCGSQLEAEAGDVEFAFFGANYGGESREKQYYVTCPVCGEDTFVPEEKLTEKVKAQARPYDPKG